VNPTPPASTPPRAPTPPAPTPAPPPSDGSTQRTIGWIGVVAGAGTGVLGVALALSAADDNSHLAQNCSPTCAASQVDGARNKATIADLMMGGGALVGIGGVILVATAPSGPPEPASEGSTQRTLGWVAIGSGAAAVGTGIVLRVLAASDRDQGLRECAGGAGISCSASGLAVLERAQSRETISNWVLASGAALAVTGVILELTAPSAKNTSVAVGPSGVRIAQAF
jgi:hypothetical protein